MPAVEYEGKALYESLIINEFFEEAYPNAPPLLPADPYERSYARLWIDFITKSFVPSFMRLVMGQTADVQDKSREELYTALRTFSSQVKGPYFLGEQFSLVDIAIAPWIVRDYLIAEHRGYNRAAAGDAWKKYAEIVEKRESVLNVQSVRIS